MLSLENKKLLKETLKYVTATLGVTVTKLDLTTN